MQLLDTGGLASRARSARLDSGLAMRSMAVSCKISGSVSSPYFRSSSRMASSCSCAARTILVGVRAVAVDAAVDGVAHVLLHFCLHDAHRRERRADRCEHVLNGFGLLEIRDVSAAAHGVLGCKAHFQHEIERLAAHARVAREQFEMVALVRVGHAAAGEKRPAEETLPAAVGFKHAVVDVVGNGALLPEDFQDRENLFRRCDEECALARRALRRHMVK